MAAEEDVGEKAKFGSELKLRGVRVKLVDEELEVLQEFDGKLDLECTRAGKTCKVCFCKGGKVELDISVSDSAHLYRAGPSIVFLRFPRGSAIITTKLQKDATKLLVFLESSLPAVEKRSELSTFNLRTENSSAKQYFQFYGYLSQQQNMLQDYVRTGTYQSAMLQNTTDFKGKIVLDVGAGTGVLSFFALQAGARKVYSIEASSMAVHCQKLVKENGYADKMTVIMGKVEEVEVPEKVDMIISEPMGYMLFNERMLETYLHAKKWLKPGGNMFPTKGILYAAPFSDEGLYLEQFSKANFWTQNSFHGIDVSCLGKDALEEYFKQPVLDTFDVRIVMAKPVGHMTDFLKANETDLIKIEVPLQYKMWSTGMVHGLAFWFDCVFCGSESSVWLSTAPFQPLTHWYQIRLLLPKPMFLQKDQEMVGHLSLVANERQSYDVTVKLAITGSNVKSESMYDLKNPNFRYMTTPLSVPGSIHTSPTEGYFQESSSLASQQAAPVPTPQVNHVNHSQKSSQLAPSVGGTTSSSGTYFPVLGSQTLTSSVAAQSSIPSIAQPYQMQGLAQSLNPAAPQFVPLPTSGHTNGILAPSAGGFHQSTALYNMGSQQTVYTQSLPELGGQGYGGHAKYQGAMASSPPQLRQNYASGYYY